MKNIKHFLVNESKTNSTDIINYGHTWVREWGPSNCANIIKWFLTGVKDEMNNYGNEKYGDNLNLQKSCIKFIDKTLKDIDKAIQ